MKDDPTFDAAPFFERSNAFLKRCQGNSASVLVHCIAGVSRSVVLVLAFLVKEHHMRLDHAIQQVRRGCAHTLHRAQLTVTWCDQVTRVRPFAEPNNGFKFAIAHYEVQVRGSTSVWNHFWFQQLYSYQRAKSKWTKAPYERYRGTHASRGCTVQ